MAGKFVSAGTLDNPSDRDDAWLQAEQELEERRKENERTKAAHDGKTLFEVLQANKAAKEEVFQESIKLKNQFRALNDDEVDFLDSQVDAKIAKERAIQQETSEQLRLFRERQDASDANGFDAAADEQAVHDSTTAELDTTNWAPSKKRKRVKEKEVIKGVKLRRNSSDVHGSHPVASAQDKPTSDSMKSMGQAVVISKKEDISTNSASPPKMQGLGLVNYDSDDEDD